MVQTDRPPCPGVGIGISSCMTKMIGRGKGGGSEVKEDVGGGERIVIFPLYLLKFDLEIII